MITKNLRIHGDNIVECERSLHMINEAVGGKMKLLDGPIYMPKYQIQSEDIALTVELLSGHGRWGVDIGGELKKNGGILREGADSYITEIKGEKETLLIAIEYCSALPAGNNAWQRNGRALSSVLAGVPYLYIAELGGVELDAKRQVKHARYPNAIVPFSYICTTRDYSYVCAPVYRPHPSISQEIYNKFSPLFGYNECLELLCRILHDTEYSELVDALVCKTMKLVEVFSSEKKRQTSLAPLQWRSFLESDNRAEWLVGNCNLVWKKKTASKVLSTDSFKKLLAAALGMNLPSIGASDIPICLIPKKKINEFNGLLNHLYPQLEIKLPIDKPITLIWITGYKPKGDDSRPDRGLCPLAKMVMGNSCRYMSVVYGPAKRQTWNSLNKGTNKLAESNGLWQSIVEVCDYILIDSATKEEPEFIQIPLQQEKANDSLTIDYKPVERVQYSEHDTDTAIHQILSRSALAECLCNPPGGDWSGINYYRNPLIYRWTSLPRVSEIGGKRPDHVFQKENVAQSLFITIESKGFGADLEDNIGPNLTSYLVDLFSLVPTSIKMPNKDWTLYNATADLGSYTIISVGAFIYKNDMELQTHMCRGQLDCIMAFDFGEMTTLHLHFNERGEVLKGFIEEASERIGGFKIKVY